MPGIPSSIGNIPVGSSMLSRTRFVLGPGAPRNGDLMLTSMPVSGDIHIRMRNRPWSKNIPIPT